MHPQNENITQGYSTTLVTRAPGCRFPKWLRFRARGQLTINERRRLNLAQADLIGRILRIPGVRYVRITSSSIVVQAYCIKPLDKFQVQLYMVSFVYETHAGEEWQKIKELGGSFRLAS